MRLGYRSDLTQGYPLVTGEKLLIGRRWVLQTMLVLGSVVPAHAQPHSITHCTAPPGMRVPSLDPLAPNVWLVRAAEGDADATNRGLTTLGLVVKDGSRRGGQDRQRVWIVGAGPSPAAAAVLRCAVEHTAGHSVTDVVFPWPRAELTLGAAAFDGARLWAHRDVAHAMSRRCPVCTQRMRARLGDEQADLGPDPVRLPTRTVQGVTGQMGPFRWWRLERVSGTPVMVLALPAWLPSTSSTRARLITGHGLLWPAGVPDLRDATVESMLANTMKLAQITATWPAGTMVVGEQGQVSPLHATLRDHLEYWRELQAAVQRGLLEGSDGINPSLLSTPHQPTAAHRLQHELNWQRAWRLAEQKL
jgi:hypothetical protein